MYCTYDQYISLGGSMTDAEYAVWGPRASRVIDRLTFGRIKRCKLPDEVMEAIADACAQIADLMQVQDKARRKSYAGALASANTDGYSESYVSASDAAQSAEIAAGAILADALGDDPCNLLYAGVCGC